MSALTARSFTTRFAASRYLYEQLRDSTDPALDAAARTWGYPGENAGAELVWVGAVEPADQDPAAIGRGQRQEAYTVSVYCDVAMSTADPADVNERLEVYVHAVEGLVHADATLGGNVQWAQVAEVATVMETQPATESAYAGVVRVQVACRARI